MTNFDVFPELSAPQLDMVALQATHAPALFSLFTNPSVTQYYHVVPLTTETDMERVIGKMQAMYSEGRAMRWGIAVRGQKEIIGTIGFSKIVQGHKATIVFALQPEYWSRGFITEAIRVVIRYGFKELGVNRIEAEVMPGNAGSEKVLLKTGFSFEGLLRQWTLWNGIYYDMNMYAVVKYEYPNL